jgi:hypothetical protein
VSPILWRNEHRKPYRYHIRRSPWEDIRAIVSFGIMVAGAVLILGGFVLW